MEQVDAEEVDMEKYKGKRYVKYACLVVLDDDELNPYWRRYLHYELDISNNYLDQWNNYDS